MKLGTCLKGGLICFAVALVGAGINFGGWHAEQRWIVILGYAIAAVGVVGGVCCILIGLMGGIRWWTAKSNQSPDKLK